MKKWLGIAVALVVAVALIALGGRHSGRKTELVRLGYFPNITHTQALVGVADGSFQKALGPDVKVDPKVFNAGPDEMEALFAGQIDIGYIGPGPAVTGYIRSNGEALKVIAGATSGGASLVVRKQSGITTPAGLVGRRIASPQLGNTQDIALRHYLDATLHAKLAETGGNTRVVPIRNPDILTLFKKGDLDAAWVPEPWAARLVHDGGGKILLDERTLWPQGKFSTAVVIVRKKFLEEHPNLVAKFVQAHVTVTDWANAHPEAAQHAASSEIKRLTGKALPAEVLKDAYSRLSVTYDPLTPTVKRCAQWSYALGFLGKSQPQLDGLFDASFLDKALRSQPTKAKAR